MPSSSRDHLPTVPSAPSHNPWCPQSWVFIPGPQRGHRKFLWGLMHGYVPEYGYVTSTLTRCLSFIFWGLWPWTTCSCPCWGLFIPTPRHSSLGEVLHWVLNKMNLILVWIREMILFPFAYMSYSSVPGTKCPLPCDGNTSSSVPFFLPSPTAHEHKVAVQKSGAILDFLTLYAIFNYAFRMLCAVAIW